jgi:molybdate transport system permease protein
MPDAAFWSPLWLSLRLAAVTTACLLALGLPLAWWLACGRSPLRPFLHGAVTLPLLLPPTVLGFYLLTALGRRLVFTFWGLVAGSIVYSLPFMVQPIESALAALPLSLSEAAEVLGKSRWETFRRVLLPNVTPALWTACILTFAHTLGEFGVVLMIGGAIPGRTRVASIAIFNEVESMNYDRANLYAAVLLAGTLPLLWAFETYRRRGRSEPA